jgi:hypothetical protein
MTEFDINATGKGVPLTYDLPGIQKSTVKLEGFYSPKPPLKVGDRGRS